MFKRWMYPFLDASTEGTPGGGETPPDANAPWYQKAGVAADHHEWLAGKEFADSTTAIASHRALEGMVGRNRLAIPNGPDDKDAYGQIYRTLGRPDAADGYKLPDAVAKVFKPDEWKTFAPIFHEAGASQSLVDKVTTAYADRAAKIAEAAEAERTAAETREVEALEKEWASNTQANKDVASRAFRALGINEEMTSKLEGALGYMATMKLFHNIGKGMSESAFHQDTETRGGDKTTTADAVQAKITARLADPEFKARYNDRDPRRRASAIEEMEGLQKQLAEIRTKAAQQGAGA